MNNYISLDFETGGFNEKKNPITEVGMVAINGETLKFKKEKLNFYVKPYNNLIVEQQALKASHVTMKQVMSGEDGETTYKVIRDYFKEYKTGGKGDTGLPVIVAHNVAFDRKFLEDLFTIHKDNIYKYAHPIPQCTLQISKQAFGHKGVKLKLGNVCEYLGITLIDAHSALNDAIACGKVFVHFTHLLRNTGSAKAKNKAFENTDLFEFKM